MRIKSLIATIAMIAVIAIPQFARADSAFGTGSPATARANVDFQINVPGFVFFQVGSLGVADEIVFNVPAANVGDSSSVSGSGGDGGPSGTVTVVVISNAGPVTLTENAGDTALTRLTGTETISWDEITTALTSGTVPVIPLTDGSTSSAALPEVAGITSLSGTWTYSYDNTTTPVAGTYEGTATYDAAIP